MNPVLLVRLTARIRLVEGEQVSCEVEEKVLAKVDAKGALEYLKNPNPMNIGKEEKAS